MTCFDDSMITRLLDPETHPSAEFDAHLDVCASCRALVGAAMRAAQSASRLPASARDPGDRAGRYVLLNLLGEGATGVVYRAHDPELDRNVAVKLLSPSVDPRHDLSLLEEARAMAQLSHPNVVRVYDVGTAGGSVFVAMELLTGGTLRAWHATSPSWSAVLTRYLEAGRGLAAAHSIGLIHRDFKPDNVLLASDGRACVCDFGLAGQVEPTTDREDVDGPTRRSVGTPRYMAPEAHAGHELDALADQFSFCAALFEALYGRPAFEGETAEALAIAKNEGTVAQPPSVGPAALLAVVRRGLERDPAARFGSMDALLAGLERIVDRGRRRRVAAAIGGVVAATAGLTAWAAGPSEPSCEGPRTDVEEVWNDTRRLAIVEASQELPAPAATAMVERALERLDVYTDRWTETKRATCRAETSGKLTEASARAGAACLDLRLAAVDGLVTALERLDSTGLELVSTAVWSLPDLETCLDPSAPAPPNADIDTLLALQRRRGAILLGRFEDSASELTRLRDDAVDRGDVWSAAAAGAELCRVRSLQAHPESEREACTNAAHDALRGGHDRAAVRAWVRLMELETESGRIEFAEVYEELAASVLEGLSDPRLAASLESARAGKHRGRKPAEALKHEQLALAHAIEAYGGEEHPRVATYMVQVALLRSQATDEPSLPELQRAREIILATEGDNSLALARTWEVEAGEHEDDPEAAVYASEQAVAITERVAGPDAVRTLLTQANLAMLRADAQPTKIEQALAELEAAISGLERAGAGDRSQLLTYRLAHALMLHRVGRGEEAVAGCRKATRSMETFHGPRTYMMAMTRAMCAQVYDERGLLEEARDELEAALSLTAETLGQDHPKYAGTAATLADLETRIEASRARGLGGDALAAEPR